ALSELDILADVSGAAIDSVKARKEFNSETYWGIGQYVFKVTSGGGNLDYVADVGATITDFETSVGTNLYITIGDGANYYFMTTSEVFTQKNKAGTFLLHYDGKLVIADSAGNVEYSADPNAGSPTWTDGDDNGSLADVLDDNDLQSLFLYRDAAGEDIPYAGTKKGVWAYDLTNTKWLQTELKLPNHPNGGKGAVVWREGAYVASGLHIDRYRTGQAQATINSVGLDEDDGLPIEYDGEIVDLIGGYSEFFALVDSTQTSGTSTSSIYAKTELGWHCIWIGDSTEKAMNRGIVTTSPAYRFWWDHDDKLYWIQLHRSIQHPRKISGYTFGTSGVHI
ncbi:hypothetical protein LCGC14_3152700, partial [marine sediment metagenome]